MKAINIYLTDDQKKQALKICQKYQVSISTIIDVVSCQIIKLQLENFTEIGKTYYFKEKGKRTSVKPRHNDVINIKEFKNGTFYTNCLKMYIFNDWTKLQLNIDEVRKLKVRIENQLVREYDRFWNYNENIRNTRRMMKENKNYWKKVLEEL